MPSWRDELLVVNGALAQALGAVPGFDADVREAAAVGPDVGDGLAGGLDVGARGECDPEQVRLDEAGGFDVVNVGNEGLEFGVADA